jgi:hypothetical protein
MSSIAMGLVFALFTILALTLIVRKFRTRKRDEEREREIAKLQKELEALERQGRRR